MNIKARAKFLLIFSLLVSIPGHVQSSYMDRSSIIADQDTVQPADTLSICDAFNINLCKGKDYRFKASQLILPGAFIAVGTFGVYNGAFKKLDIKIKKEMDRLREGHFFHADDYIQYLPALTNLTLGSIGVKSKHNFKERVMIEATAYMTMAVFTNVGKYSFKEKRPDSGARNSFPSGHTATVFTGAELIREEYSLGIGIGAYSVATAVAFLRLYNGRHWLNDVLAGVGIG
ncbi:MAG: phosphatase PAP2 family protein, partial [Muribaculaceae bacterium]|nr:phosphatase PAP2 family protein [Muribaculaceae bacterium]